ncbi:MAG: peptidoglycan DD-metalloendopeptidase family protein [Gammaproteobacteria bacterium]
MGRILFIKRGRLHQFDTGAPAVLALFGIAVVTLAVALFVGGYGTSRWLERPAGRVAAMKSQIELQAREVVQVKQKAQANIDALSAKVSELQAHIVRLDALGEQLTHLAGLKRGEFNFNQAPAEGGPDVSGPIQHVALPDFLDNLNELSSEISSREQQLTVLQRLLMNRAVEASALPSGMPIAAGYETSPFGMRIDPFTGELSFHPGIDFAGPEGEPVHATAAGVVTWAGGNSDGFGNMVEIDNGNGYSTLYGHNERVLVHVGEIVKKGEEIALLGSTGRSTGPHVHFEVLYNGKPINPAPFVNAKGKIRFAALPRSLD